MFRIEPKQKNAVFCGRLINEVIECDDMKKEFNLYKHNGKNLNDQWFFEKANEKNQVSISVVEKKKEEKKEVRKETKPTTKKTEKKEAE